jgi:hypothetical protein
LSCCLGPGPGLGLGGPPPLYAHDCVLLIHACLCCFMQGHGARGRRRPSARRPHLPGRGREGHAGSNGPHCQEVRRAQVGRDKTRRDGMDGMGEIEIEIHTLERTPGLRGPRPMRCQPTRCGLAAPNTQDQQPRQGPVLRPPGNTTGASQSQGGVLTPSLSLRLVPRTPALLQRLRAASYGLGRPA